jgi:hypothetical protein
MEKDEYNKMFKEIFKTYQENLNSVVVPAIKKVNEELYKSIHEAVDKNEESHKKKKKRERSKDPKTKDESKSKKEKEKEPEPEVEAEPESFVCAGRIWETPIVPCQGGPKSDKKAGTQITDENGKKKNVTICHACKLVLQKKRREEKKKNE